MKKVKEIKPHTWLSIDVPVNYDRTISTRTRYKIDKFERVNDNSHDYFLIYISNRRYGKAILVYEVDDQTQPPNQVGDVRKAIGDLISLCAPGIN